MSISKHSGGYGYNALSHGSYDGGIPAVLISSLGASGTFWLYGVICALGGAFIAKNLPETKGKTLEEIENDLAGNL